jgi:tetratricopeptide (TPR) repeat protein
MAFTAARVLRCALQEMSGKYGRLQSDARQLFLDACAASADLGWDMRSVVQPLRKVIAAAPNFRPAWAQLLIADINVASFMADSPTSEQWKSALRSDLLAAQKRFPDMAEVTVAEYEANSNSTFSDSVALLDKAKSQDPDNVFVLSQHAIIMASVGRVADSVDDEQRAAQLDPLSPAVRSEYIRMLAYAGQLAAARAELARAKQLWPGADSVQQAESSLELRYGDFEKAIRQSPDYSGPGVELYIAARKNPDDANVAAVFNYLTKSGLNSGRLSMGVQALGEMNRVDDVFRLIASAPRGTLKDPYVLFRPWLAEARRDPRFMTVAKSLGLLEYWKTSGHWPDFCSDPGLKYDCKKEAARLGA